MQGHTVPLLSGAKITLGNVPITGKDYFDFSAPEIAYIIARYMAQHAGEEGTGNIYEHSISYAVKNIWPHVDFDPDSRKAKLIYFWLRKYGCRAIFVNGNRAWRVDISDLDKQHVEKPIQIRKEEPSIVVTKCLLCDEGPFASHAEFEKHRAEKHMIKMEEKMDQMALQESTENSTETKVYTCRICGREFASAGALGGHMSSHNKMWKKQKELYEAIKQAEGLHPREYAMLLNKTNGSVSSLARSLVKTGRIRVEGRRGAARYYLSRHSRRSVESVAVGEALGGKQATKPIEAVPTPEAVVTAPMPEAIAPMFADAVRVWETTEGKLLILFKDGNLYQAELTKISV